MAEASSESVRRPRGFLSATVATLRPKQWVKNLFVFGPLLFSGKMADSGTDLMALVAFALFCATSSAVYILNDLMDVKADRLHPVKRNRPIAAGELSLPAAVGLALVLGVGAIAAAWALNPAKPLFAGILLAYIVLNVAYSMGLKRIVIIDVMMIGAGFVLRVLAGTSVLSISPSHWLILCTILLSVFLGFTKRRAEIVLLEESAVEHRSVLNKYSAAFLDQMISVVTATTLMCYILYTVDARTMRLVSGGSRGLLLTVPFVMYGIFRYLYIVYRREKGDSPTQALLSDKMLIASIAMWGLLSSSVVYFPQYFKGWFSN